MGVVADLKTFAVFRRLVGQWWCEPVDYLGHVQFFSRRSLAGVIKLLIGVGTGLVAVVALVILLPAAGPRLPAARLVVAGFSAVTLSWSLAWCFRPWPSQPWSSAFMITSDLGIAAVALFNANWVTGLFGLNTLVLISVYLLFFGGPRALALHVAWILTTTVLFVVRVGAGDHLDRVSLAVKIFGVAAPIVAVPIGIQFGIWVLRTDAVKSVTDPLTGLLNRRGLHLYFSEALRAGLSPDAGIIVIVADLDRFKNVNDTFGHAVGDTVLIRCARQIESVVRPTTLVARVGGEEFVVVAVGYREPRRGEQKAERIRRAIAAPTEFPVTASIGVTRTTVEAFEGPESDYDALLDGFITRADQAMFQAKRAGGNTAVCTYWSDADKTDSD